MTWPLNLTLAWMNAWMIAWLYEFMNGCMNECMNYYLNHDMHEWLHECVNDCMMVFMTWHGGIYDILYSFDLFNHDRWTDQPMETPSCRDTWMHQKIYSVSFLGFPGRQLWKNIVFPFFTKATRRDGRTNGRADRRTDIQTRSQRCQDASKKWLIKLQGFVLSAAVVGRSNLSCFFAHH